MHFRKIVFGLFVLFFIPACGQMTFEEKLAQLYHHTVPQLKAAELASREEVVILDIRSIDEFNVSHIEGAKLIDYDSFNEQDVKDIDKSAEIIVYCSVGYRSEKVGEKLLEMGFPKVLNLYGGIFEWKNNGFEVYNDRGVTDSVHTYNQKWSQWLKNGVKVYE
ncbi:MAG: rhodanese-like domain-containing protein [Cyclobacteriaceae bacterium]